MDGIRATHVTQIHIEGVLLAAGPEGLLVEAIGPRRQERDSAQLRLLLELGDVSIGEIENVFPMDVHLIRRVADRGNDGDLNAVHRVGQADYLDAMIGGAFGRIVLREAGKGDRQKQ